MSVDAQICIWGVGLVFYLCKGTVAIVEGYPPSHTTSVLGDSAEPACKRLSQLSSVTDIPLERAREGHMISPEYRATPYWLYAPLPRGLAE